MRIAIFVLILFCSSCASQYDPVYKSVTSKENISRNNGITLTYWPTALNDESGYAKKASKKDLHFISVKLTNDRDSAIYLTKRKFDVYIDYEPVSLVEQNKVKKKLKQRPGYHLLWFLSAAGMVGNYNGEIVIHPIGVGLGAAGTSFGIYNYIRGRKANKEFYQEFMTNSLLSQTIPKGKSAEGWLCIEYEGELKKLMIKFDDQD